MAGNAARETRPSGHLQVKGDRRPRSWYALWRDADGRHQKRLGPAHVKDTGRRTPRGAIVWRAADGPKPGPSYLSPAEARDELSKLLAQAVREPTDPRHKRDVDHTVGEACDAWLHYVEHEKARRPSTVRDYRNALRCYLLPEFGKDTLLRTIDTRSIDTYRERLLTEGELSRRTIQKILVQLYSILKRAKRKGWIDTNPAEDAERVTVPRTGEFTVLTPDEVHAVARADGSELYGAIYVTAAFTGLRLGELRALRWLDVDFANRIVHVRRNLVRDAHGAPKSQRVRSVPLTDPVAVVLDTLSHRDTSTGPEDLVFTLGYNEPIHQDTVRKRFYAALKRAGLGHLRDRDGSKPDSRIVFHDLRHTFGTLAVRAFPLSDVMAMMGHADISTTMIYVHHVPQHDAAARLTALLERDSVPSTVAPRSA
jgi:integrase